jgi:hypothetical protein
MGMRIKEMKFTEDIAKGVRLLKKHKIRVVVFDMDQTAIAAHSRGTLLRSNFKEFTSRATPAFLQLVMALYNEGSFQIAIATHSDEAEFQNGRHVEEVHPLTHIMGFELATQTLLDCFSSEVAQSILVVSYNPRARGTMEDPESCVKRYHMRKIKNYFKASFEEMIFFDDTPEIVKDCIDNLGVKAVLVAADTGFQIEDLLNAFPDDR